MMPMLKNILNFDIDESNFEIRFEQINSRLRLYPRILLSQVAIALLLVGIMWNGVAHNILLLWLLLVCAAHTVEAVYWILLHKQATNISQCRSWNIRFCWFSAIAGVAWGSCGLLMFVDGQMLYQMFLISVVLGLSGGAVTSNPVHPPSLFIHLLALVLPIVFRIFWEGDLQHLILGGMLLIYIVFVISAAKELISTFEQSLRQRIENENLVGRMMAQQEKTARANKDAEEANIALRKNEALLRESQAIAGLGSYILDVPTGRWQSSEVLNSIFGMDDSYDYSIESWRALIHPDERALMTDYFANEVIGKGKTFDKEYRIINQTDNTVRWVQGLGRLEFDEYGQALKMHGTIQDITERKKTEQIRIESIRLLEEKELAKTRFLAAAGHDLRQPLAAANLFIDALKFTQPTKNQSEIIQRLDQAMMNFNGLLDALLNVSKLDAGLIRPEYTSVSLTNIFSWLEQSFAPLAIEKRIRFKLHFPFQEPLSVRADIGLLNSVLMNLVSNAIKFTNEGGILVSARRRGNDVLFQIWDTGIGIQHELISKIFDEFYQISNPQRDRTMGLGLGLSIAKRASALFDGKLTCHSRIGRGSVFEFCLPIDGGSEAKTIQSQTASQKEFGAAVLVHGKTFVIVEDDALVAEALSKALDEMHGKVLLFHRAELALNHADIEKADFYIVDYMLGGTLNGIQFLEQLRQKSGKAINAVIMSGDTSADFVKESSQYDWPVLHKPVNLSTLIKSLAGHLN